VARSGRSLSSLAKELGVTDTSIRNWLRQADLDEGRRQDGLTSDEKAELAQLRRENRVLREERDILKSSGLLREGERVKFAFIAAERASFPTAFMCRHLGVSKSGFYAWQDRPECDRAREDRRLAVLTREAHEIGRKAYGSPRVHQELKAQGVCVSRKRVIRLMQKQGLKGKTRQRW
jgi:putative transposase